MSHWHNISTSLGACHRNYSLAFIFFAKQKPQETFQIFHFSSAYSHTHIHTQPSYWWKLCFSLKVVCVCIREICEWKLKTELSQNVNLPLISWKRHELISSYLHDQKWIQLCTTQEIGSQLCSHPVNTIHVQTLERCNQMAY